MMDAAKIYCLSGIDFSRGFHRFHVKWPLKNLTIPKRSSVFKTTVIDGPRDIRATLSWSLGIISQNDNSPNTWFGVFLHNWDRTIPIIYQVSLSSSSSSKTFFNRSSIALIDEKQGCGLAVPQNELAEYPVNDLVLQFWMDIPNVAALGINYWKRKRGPDDDYEVDFENSGTAGFLLDTAKVFDRVVGTEFDPLSDVSIIIVKKVEEVCGGKIIKKEEELRRFHCHTIFLATRSTVFEKMLVEEWKENCAKDGRSVRIDDIDAQIMETVLRYIYISSLPDSSTTQTDLFGIIHAANKYHLWRLKHWCCAVLISKNDSIESRRKQLVLADRQNLVQLKAVFLAQLSMCFTTASDPAMVNDIPTHLWSQIMEAISERNRSLITIELPAV